MDINIGDLVLFKNKPGIVIAGFFKDSYSLYFPQEVFVAFADENLASTVIVEEFKDIWRKTCSEDYYYEFCEDISKYCGKFGLWIDSHRVKKINE